MSKLTLTYTQRINICFDLRLQTGNAGQLRAFWKLEDLMALDAKEKTAIKLESRIVNGQEVYLWDASAVLPETEVEVSANELSILRDVVSKSQHRGQDRIWLEPLLAELEKGKQ